LSYATLERVKRVLLAPLGLFDFRYALATSILLLMGVGCIDACLAEELGILPERVLAWLLLEDFLRFLAKIIYKLL
jgi:hypothetical protein